MSLENKETCQVEILAYLTTILQSFDISILVWNLCFCLPTSCVFILHELVSVYETHKKS